MQSAKKLRYEVLYKNILRDCRKFYLDFLVEEVGFKSSKANSYNKEYSNSITRLVALSGLKEVAQRMKVDAAELEECLRRFIFPRELIKELRIHD